MNDVVVWTVFEYCQTLAQLGDKRTRKERGQAERTRCTWWMVSKRTNPNVVDKMAHCVSSGQYSFITERRLLSETLRRFLHSSVIKICSLKSSNETNVTDRKISNCPNRSRSIHAQRRSKDHNQLIRRYKRELTVSLLYISNTHNNWIKKVLFLLGPVDSPS